MEFFYVYSVFSSFLVTEMKFKEFSRLSKKTLKKDFSLLYLCVGAAGEMGELLNFVKKMERDGTDHTDDIILECGDVLYYLSQIMEKVGSSLQNAATENLDKTNAYDY